MHLNISLAFDPDKKPCSKRQAIANENCMFCKKGCEEHSLHQILTFDANTNICTLVTELQDTNQSGWTAALTEVEVTSCGVAVSLLKRQKTSLEQDMLIKSLF